MLKNSCDIATVTGRKHWIRQTDQQDYVEASAQLSSTSTKITYETVRIISYLTCWLVQPSNLQSYHKNTDHH